MLLSFLMSPPAWGVFSSPSSFSFVLDRFHYGVCWLGSRVPGDIGLEVVELGQANSGRIRVVLDHGPDKAVHVALRQDRSINVVDGHKKLSRLEVAVDDAPQLDIFREVTQARRDFETARLLPSEA